MKTALYVTGDDSQVVFTAETEWEKQILRVLVPERAYGGDQNQTRQAVIMRGSFYECRGGWYRQGTDDHSVMVRIAGQPIVRAPEEG